MFSDLDTWLTWLESNHPKKIDLTLDRITVVAKRLNLLNPAPAIISVAGTNGKGSTVAFIEAILAPLGIVTGCYTSPHLQVYNERIRINKQPCSATQICHAFQQIYEASDTLSLTYFEYGTLAALYLFTQYPVDVAILEVGLGGRLDAVNIVDADIAIITSIAIDHTEWLGNNRESIGFEKAGILRSGQTFICGDRNPPQSVIKHSKHLCPMFVYQQDFFSDVSDQHWIWQYNDKQFQLDIPPLLGEHQINNAATAIMAVHKLWPCIKEKSYQLGINQCLNPGRISITHSPIETIVDVSHNVESVTALATTLEQLSIKDKQIAIFSALSNKDIVNILKLMKNIVTDWFFFPLDSARAISLDELTDIAEQLQIKYITFNTFSEAYQNALKNSTAKDRIIIFGSFYTVAAHIEYQQKNSC